MGRGRGEIHKIQRGGTILTFILPTDLYAPFRPTISFVSSTGETRVGEDFSSRSSLE